MVTERIHACCPTAQLQQHQQSQHDSCNLSALYLQALSICVARCAKRKGILLLEALSFPAALSYFGKIMLDSSQGCLDSSVRPELGVQWLSGQCVQVQDSPAAARGGSQVKEAHGSHKCIPGVEQVFEPLPCSGSGAY